MRLIFMKGRGNTFYHYWTEDILLETFKIDIKFEIFVGFINQKPLESYLLYRLSVPTDGYQIKTIRPYCHGI